MLQRFNNRNAERALILIALFFITAALALSLRWIKGNYSLRGSDVSVHAASSIEYYTLLSGIAADTRLSPAAKFARSIALFTRTMPEAASFYPNGVYLTTSPFYAAFGKNLFALKLSNLPYVLLLLTAVFGIGLFMGSPLLGVLAALILYLYPLIFEGSRQYGLDLPLAAMVTLSVFLLLKSDSFRHTGYSLLFGLSAGAGMLVKLQLPLFVAAPAACALLPALSRGTDRGRVFRNASLAATAALLLASPWLLTYRSSLFDNLLYNFLDPYAFNAGRFTFSGMTAHLRQLALRSMGVPAFGVFVIALVAFSVSRTREKYLFLAWFFAPVVLFSLFFYSPWDRYLMPILPAAALMTAWGVLSVKDYGLRSLLLIVLSVVLFHQFAYLSFGRGKPAFFRALYKGTDYGSVPVREDIYALGQLVDAVKQQAPASGGNVILLIAPADREPGAFYLRYVFKLGWSDASALDLGIMYHSVLAAFDRIGSIVVKTPSGSRERTWTEYVPRIPLWAGNTLRDRDTINARRLLEKKIAESRNTFILAQRIPTSEGFEWEVYKRK